MRISDWSSDMCSSDLVARERPHIGALAAVNLEDCVIAVRLAFQGDGMDCDAARLQLEVGLGAGEVVGAPATHLDGRIERRDLRSEERRGGTECVRTCRSRWAPCH